MLLKQFVKAQNSLEEDRGQMPSWGWGIVVVLIAIVCIILIIQNVDVKE